MLETAGRATSAVATSGVSYILIPGSSDVSNAMAVNGAASGQDYAVQVVAADCAVAGKTTKLRVRGTIASGASASAITWTFGLYPLTITTSSITPGTVVANSTFTIASPAASVFTTATGADFDIPSDGLYAVGYTCSAAPTGNHVLLGRVHVRNV